MIRIAVCALLAASCGSKTSEQRGGLEAADRACARDTDCVIVHDDCCDCAHGDGPVIVNQVAAARIPRPEGCDHTPCKPVVNGSPACNGARAVCRGGACTAESPTQELP